MGSLIDNFGNIVDDLASRDPEKAKNLLVTGYRFERLRLKTIANKGLPPFRKYLPSLMMDNIINSLNNSKKSAMVSIFVPCEPLAAMGIIPYSLEGLSSYITGTNMHGGCLEECKKKGFPETLCSYHRVYIGAAERQLMPKPPFIIYSNLACDANQITFKYLAEKFSIPSFYIDVPYNQNHESVLYVALQLRKMVNFIETCTGQKMSEEAFAKAMKRSKNTIDNYKDYLYNQKTKYVKGDITSEMYMAVTNHILLGTKEQENLSKMCLENIDAAPNNKGLKLLWVHTIPFWQEPLRNLFNFNESEF